MVSRRVPVRVAIGGPFPAALFPVYDPADGGRDAIGSVESKSAMGKANYKAAFCCFSGSPLGDFGVANDVFSADPVGLAAVGLRECQHLVEALSANHASVAVGCSVAAVKRPFGRIL